MFKNKDIPQSIFGIYQDLEKAKKEESKLWTNKKVLATTIKNFDVL